MDRRSIGIGTTGGVGLVAEGFGAKPVLLLFGFSFCRSVSNGILPSGLEDGVQARHSKGKSGAENKTGNRRACHAQFVSSSPASAARYPWKARHRQMDLCVRAGWSRARPWRADRKDSSIFFVLFFFFVVVVAVLVIML